MATVKKYEILQVIDNQKDCSKILILLKGTHKVPVTVDQDYVLRFNPQVGGYYSAEPAYSVH